MKKKKEESGGSEISNFSDIRSRDGACLMTSNVTPSHGTSWLIWQSDIYGVGKVLFYICTVPSYKFCPGAPRPTPVARNFAPFSTQLNSSLLNFSQLNKYCPVCLNYQVIFLLIGTGIPFQRSPARLCFWEPAPQHDRNSLTWMDATSPKWDQLVISVAPDTKERTTFLTSSFDPKLTKYEKCHQANIKVAIGFYETGLMVSRRFI